MTVDFAVKRVSGCTVASLSRVGPWKEDNLREEFNRLVRWARKRRVRTGRWFFYEHDGPGAGRRRWEACLEIKGKTEPEGRIRVKKLPAETVAHIVFDPKLVSARVIYHGLSDWIRWRLRYREFKGTGATREVYDGNPWTDRHAWAKADVQVIIRK